MATGTIAHAAPENAETVIKLVSYSYKWNDSLAADKTLNLTATNFGISTPSGYTPLGVAFFTSGSNTCVVTRINPTATGSTVALSIRNKATSTQTEKTAKITIMYIRNNFIG